MKTHLRASLLIAMLALATVAFAPAASAHKCAHHDPNECNAGSCPDGEYHDHTDFNDDEEDYHCSSEASDGDACYFPAGVGPYPPVICDLLGYSDDPGAPGTPGIPQCGPDQRMAVEPGLVVCVIPQ